VTPVVLADDVDVVVPGNQIAIVIDRLRGLGYLHEGDLGVPGREAFKRPPGSPPHHLYVCRVGGAALANHIAVRDYLRAYRTKLLPSERGEGTNQRKIPIGAHSSAVRAAGS
jgi:GrpB-like predicted nucleotidyltransferase (UPF0157 family)